MIGKIAVSAANFAIDKPYSYVIPQNLQVQPGVRVVVPFGRGNRTSEGVILGIDHEKRREELKVLTSSKKVITIIILVAADFVVKEVHQHIE